MKSWMDTGDFDVTYVENNSKVSEGLNASLAIYGNDVVEAALRGYVFCFLSPTPKVWQRKA